MAPSPRGRGARPPPMTDEALPELDPARIIDVRAGSLDGQPANADPVVADHHERPGLEIRGEPIQAGEQAGRLALRSSRDLTTEQDHAGYDPSGMGEQGPEVRIEGQKHAAVLYSGAENDRVRGAGEPNASHMDRVMATLDEQAGDPRRESFIKEKPQAPRRTGRSRSRTASAA